MSAKGVGVAPQGKRFWKKSYTTKTSFFDPKNGLLQYSYLILGHPVYIPSAFRVQKPKVSGIAPGAMEATAPAPGTFGH